MLDVDEMAAYESWKSHKLTNSVDLSVSAFNVECEAVAVAFELGVDAAFKGVNVQEDAAKVKGANPYRQKGMTGYIPPENRRVTS